VDQISKADRLPASSPPYRLSPDAKYLIGEAEFPDPAPVPQAPSKEEHVNGLAHTA
jgi:hypothetical protein